MTKNFEELLQETEGEGPSEQFVTDLRSRIVAELEAGPVVPPEDALTIILDSVDTRPPGRESRIGPRILVVAAAAVALVVAMAILSSDGEPSEIDTINLPPGPSTTVPEPEAAIERESDSVPGRDPTPMTLENSVLPDGQYLVDTLGTELTLTFDESLWLYSNDNGVVSVTALLSGDFRDDRTLTFRRLASLPDPSAPLGDTGRPEGWPASDFSGWLDALDDTVRVGDRLSTTVNGVPAVRVEIALDDLGCRSDRRCPDPGFDPNARQLMFAGSQYTMWLVDQGEFEPLLIVAAIDDDGEQEWFDTAEQLVDTAVIGTPKSSPLRYLSVGAVDVALWGGAQIELPGDAVVVEPFDGFVRLLPEEQEWWVEFLVSPLTLEAEALQSADAFLSILEAEQVEVTELDPVRIDGFEARSFIVSAGSFPETLLKRRAADFQNGDAGWQPPFGRIWILDHPDRGLLIASEHGTAEDETTRRVWVDEALQSMVLN